MILSGVMCEKGKFLGVKTDLVIRLISTKSILCRRVM